MPKLDTGDYYVKNVKTFLGHEGPGYNATLYKGGRRIADLTDQGDGGAPYIHYIARGPDARAADEKELTAFVASLPEETWKIGTDCHVVHADLQLEHFLSMLVDLYEMERKMRRLCKTQTIFRLKGDDYDSYRSINKPYSAEVRQYLEEKYGPQLDVILNNDIAMSLPPRVTAPQHDAEPSL